MAYLLQFRNTSREHHHEKVDEKVRVAANDVISLKIP
jgi:hypothetical protein